MIPISRFLAGQPQAVQQHTVNPLASGQACYGNTTGIERPQDLQYSNNRMLLGL